MARLLPAALLLLLGQAIAAEPPKASIAARAAVGLSTALPAGAFAESARRILLQPYAAATGGTISTLAWDGGNLAALNLHPVDLALVHGAQIVAGCASGLFTTAGLTAPPPNDLPATVQSACGVPAFVNTIVLAWCAKHVPAPPDWRVFWDVARHPGRRGLPRAARASLEIALMADGVATSDLYKVLATLQGQDRAFRKLDQLKPYVLWWDRPDQAAVWLTGGKVLMSAGWTSTLASAPPSRGCPYQEQWAGSLPEVYFWAIPANAPDKPAARRAILVATDIARQAALAAATGLAPVSDDADSMRPAGSRDASGTNLAHLAAGVWGGDRFWAAQGITLEHRFTDWVAH